MKNFLTVILLVFLTNILFSQTTVSVKSYLGLNYSLDSNQAPVSKITGKDKSKFVINDVFVGVESPDYYHWSGSAVVNYNETDKVNLYTASLNYGFFINKNLVKFNLGKLENPWYNLTNTYWNNYLIENVGSYKYGIFGKTDGGVQGNFSSKYINGILNVSNGGNDSSKSIQGILVVKPFKTLSIGGTYFKLRDAKTYGGLINFNNTVKLGSLNVTGEFLQLDNGIKSTLISGYGEISPTFVKYFSLVAKYDSFKPNKDVDYTTNSLTVGFNYVPLSNVKVGLNFHNISQTNLQSHNELSVHAQINY